MTHGNKVGMMLALTAFCGSILAGCGGGGGSSAIGGGGASNSAAVPPAYAFDARVLEPGATYAPTLQYTNLTPVSDTNAYNQAITNLSAAQTANIQGYGTATSSLNYVNIASTLPNIQGGGDVADVADDSAINLDVYTDKSAIGRKGVTRGLQYTSGTTTVAGQTLYYVRATGYSDGSVYVVFYSDAAHTNQIGFRAVQAPQSVQNVNTFPYLSLQHQELTLNNVKVVIDMGIEVYDATGTNFETLTVATGSTGGQIVTVNKVQGTTKTLQMWVTGSQGTYVYKAITNSIGNGVLITAPSGITIACVVAQNQGGEILETDANNNPLLQIVWNSNGSGTATNYLSGTQYNFNNIVTYLQTGKGVQSTRHIDPHTVPFTPITDAVKAR